MDGQSLIAMLIVIAAALWLIRRSWRSLSGKTSASGCGPSGCHGCPSNNATAAKPFVDLGQIRRSPTSQS